MFPRKRSFPWQVTLLSDSLAAQFYLHDKDSPMGPLALDLDRRQERNRAHLGGGDWGLHDSRVLFDPEQMECDWRIRELNSSSAGDWLLFPLCHSLFQRAPPAPTRTLPATYL